jgi:hypothetical protein
MISNKDLEAKAIALVKLETTTWENASVGITDRVFFQMRNLIRQLRKNYWGVFDKPTDSATGREKIWVPLTESLCEAVVKNIDLDTKDINFRALNKKAIGFTSLVRMIVKHYLDKMFFGEYLDVLERDLAIDGTAVWKTIEYKDENGYYCIKIVRVDLLNCYIDPQSRSIKEAYRFTERGLLTQQELQGMTDWINTKDVQPTAGLAPIDSINRSNAGNNGSKFVDVYEMWGKGPKSLLTGNEDDESQEVELHIVVSGIGQPGREKCHLVEENKGVRPYEEAWYTRIPGRWYGKGIAEKVMMLQLWINTVVNIRINRATVAQLGLFKVRKGAGITPQMLSRLGANGAITVNDPSDIEQFQMQEASEASYQDEGNIWDWSQKVTSAYDITTGDSLPASTPATNAAISNQNAMSMFTMIKEGVGMFLQRWIKNQAMPTIFKNITLEEIIQISGEDSDLIKEFDEQMVYSQVFEQVDAANVYGLFIDPEQIEQEMERAFASLKAQGKDRFTKLLHEMNPTDYDVEVYITNEEFDKGAMTQNLTMLLQTMPALQQSGIDVREPMVEVMRESMDLMGLPSSGIKIMPQQPMQQNTMAAAGAGGTPLGGNFPTPAQAITQPNQTTSAMTREPAQR